jgi:hypothetical protein
MLWTEVGKPDMFLKAPLISASKSTKNGLKKNVLNPTSLASEGSKSPIETDISPITYPKRNPETDLSIDPP